MDLKNTAQFSFLKSAKARVFLALGVLVVVVVAVGFVIHWHNKKMDNAASVAVSGGPDIGSTPGAGNPSAAYIQAQNQANVQGAVAAQKSATAFIPTITRTGFVGNPDQFGQVSTVTNAAGAGQCPVSKIVLTYKPNPESCMPNNLKTARETGVTAEELLCQGCACPALKLAGFTVGDLKQIGLSAEQLHACGFDAQALMSAGFSAADLKAAGFSAADLKVAGMSAGELKAAGFSAQDLTAAGFTKTQLNSAGYNADAANTSAACNADQLTKDRVKGISAAAMRKAGCGLSALKAAGFSAGALRAAGFSAGELKAAGFSAADLKSAGFNVAALKSAGFSAAELRSAGFSAQDLKSAGFSAGQLLTAGYSPAALRDAGFSAAALRNAGVSASALRAVGYGPAALTAAGFTKGDLLRAGFSPVQAGYGHATVASAAPSAESSVAVAPTGETLPSISGDSPEARLAQFEKRQQADMNKQQRMDHIQQLQAFMSQQAGKLLLDWGHESTQQLQKAPEVKASATETSAAAAIAAAGNATEGDIIKAGSVLFAVIDTSINSDENTPIMARIVTGKLKGSKLLGAFTRQHKRLLITFTVLSDPYYAKSIAINAVAIDPDTARTALSGEVNSHYLLRYGTLFASSFLEGISDAIVNQGVTQQCVGFFCTVSRPSLTTQQQVQVGLGKVGQQYAQHMGQNFNRPPTIRIGAGTGIGVLVMGDLTLPHHKIPKAMNDNSGDMHNE